jgi:hypothetical protein
MTSEETAADLNARIARATIRAMGMQAENMNRIHRGESMAYIEDDFVNVINEEGIGYNQVIHCLQGN